MVRIDRFVGLLGVFSGLVLLAASCRDTEPPPTYARDLGSNGQPLLPTDSEWLNPAVAAGQAEWQPFREPTVDAQPGSTPDSDAEAETETHEIETEIRDLIAGYNEVVADGTTDELLDYYVEEQHETLRPWLEAAAAVEEKLAGLREGLDEKMPDGKQRIEKAFATLQGASGGELTVEHIKVISDKEVTATIGGGGDGMTYRFVVNDEDEEWYIEVSQIETLAALRPVIDVAVATYDQWLQGLQSGQTPPEAILARIEAAAQAAEAARAALGAGSDTGAAPVEERTAEDAEPEPAEPAATSENEGG